MFEICSTNFELLWMISETLNFSPTNGKIWLNSIPKALTEKFNNNHDLFNELKQFIESSALIENKNNFWTFPEFKSTHKVNQHVLPRNLRDLIFPDPKYYMIGFNLDKTTEAESRMSDWTISQSKTNDTLKKSFNKASSPLEASATSDQSWANITTKVTKSMVQKVKSNKRFSPKLYL